MSSHILQEIQATVDRIIIIHNGEIVADGTSEELISDSKGMTQLHIEIQNTDENAIQDMKAVIPSISIHSLQKLESSISAILEYPNTSDPRKDIFDHAVQHGWTILAMSASKRNLEDIFRNLTQEGDPAHA
jgi:ABC-2 type transport system ATP-binding protein